MHIVSVLGFVVGLVAFFGNGADGQIGVSICACQPGFYEFTLNFTFPRVGGPNGSNNNCDQGEIMGPGINNTSCLIDNVDDDTDEANTFFTFMSTIAVQELDQDLLPLANTRYVGPFLDGDVFTYTSVIANGLADPTDVNKVPRGFQFTIQGRNELDEDLTVAILIRYENDCGIFPLLEEGDQIGPMIFSDLGGPPVEICPVAPTRAPAATLFPTMAPQTAALPTSVPTMAPVTPAPVTDAPVPAPVTDAPVPAPITDPPVPAPVTDAPVALPVTDPPTEVDEPTQAPAGKRAPERSTPAPQVGVIQPLPPSTAPPPVSPPPPSSMPPSCPPYGKKKKTMAAGMMDEMPDGKRGGDAAKKGKKKTKSDGGMTKDTRLKAGEPGKRALNQYYPHETRSLGVGHSDEECVETPKKKSMKSPAMDMGMSAGKSKSGMGSDGMPTKKKMASEDVTHTGTTDGKRGMEKDGKRALRRFL